MTLTNCALCQQREVLVRSHIVPEFLHRPVYDEKHRTLLVPHGAVEAKTVQKGLREPLLCLRCEQILSRYERGFKKQWYSTCHGPFRLRQPIKLKLDYATVKLLVLSIVWRASVAKRPEFAAVDLGRHADRIRSMLLEEAAGPDTSYRIYAGLIVDPVTNCLWDEVLLHPLRIRVGSLWAYRMIFAGASWTLVVSSGRLSVPSVCLRAEGSMVTFATPWPEFARAAKLPEAVANLRD
jgi:hypothetical protein